MSTKKELTSKKKRQLGGDELRAVLLKDDAFKRYRVILKTMKQRHDLEDILEEAHRLHLGRLSRNLKGTNPGSQKIADSALTDSSARSRMTELYNRLGVSHDLLEIAVGAAKTHIASEYGANLPSFRTKMERMSYLDSYVSKGVQFLAEVDTIRKVLENYIKDIDQMHFQLKLAYQCLDLTMNKNKEM